MLLELGCCLALWWWLNGSWWWGAVAVCTVMHWRRHSGFHSTIRTASPLPPTPPLFTRSYVGGAPGKIDLYVGKEVVRRNIPNESACDELIELIKVGAVQKGDRAIGRAGVKSGSRAVRSACDAMSSSSASRSGWD